VCIAGVSIAVRAGGFMGKLVGQFSPVGRGQ
jgi:hypothetical protein